MAYQVALFSGQALELIVVEDEGLAVAARLDVELDAVARGDRRLECRPAVLDAPVAVKTAVGERDGAEALELSRP
jgi:hypothetical protein